MLEDSHELENNKRFYHSKKDDALLYTKLEQIVERFITLDRLKEVAHGMDTQVNESFNNTFSWLAPKNKIFCSSQSLHNRLALGIGINALGTTEYFARLFKTLGIIMTPNVKHFLLVREKKRSTRISAVKAVESKRGRKQAIFERMKADEFAALKDRAKKNGTYRSGQNLDDEMEEDESKAAVGNRKKRATIICKHCGKKGHSTTRSKKCLRHGDNMTNGATVESTVPREHPDCAAAFLAAAAIDDADDVDNMDSMPLVDDPPSDLSANEFQDCGTWSSNDDSSIVMQTGVI